MEKGNFFKSLDRAISVVKNAVRFFTVGSPLIKKGPKGEVHVDVPVMYMNFAIDRLHYDPEIKVSPKGKPTKFFGDINTQKIKNVVEAVLKEIYVLEAAEFREPENAWVILLAWNKLVVMHVKVSYEGELIPDYKLTQEVRKHVN